MSETARFEAIITPPRSFSRGGFVVLAALLAGGALLSGTLFVLLGAWPVLGFLGVEIALVLGLILAHARWSGRESEVIVVADGVLRVTRTDRRGQRTMRELPAYWARVERPPEGGAAVVMHGERIQFGRHLTREECDALAEALEAALRRARG
jgi:uncharacterized membrane protein